MNGQNAVVFALLIALLSACDKQREVVITETRSLTTKDRAPKLDATSDERFRDARPSPVEGVTPHGWLKLPSTQLRLLNYRFGESGLGEVWVSLSSGSVLDNVNRWLGQFEVAPLEQSGMDGLGKVSVAGEQGVWVTAEGEYNPGMGQEPKPGSALAGVIASVNGRILTVKMVGPAAEVKSAEASLKEFVASLKLAE